MQVGVDHLVPGGYAFVPAEQPHGVTARRPSRALVLERPYLPRAGTAAAALPRRSRGRRPPRAPPGRRGHPGARPAARWAPVRPRHEHHGLRPGRLAAVGGDARHGARPADAGRAPGSTAWATPGTRCRPATPLDGALLPAWCCPPRQEPARYLIYKDWNRWTVARSTGPARRRDRGAGRWSRTRADPGGDARALRRRRPGRPGLACARLARPGWGCARTRSATSSPAGRGPSPTCRPWRPGSHVDAIPNAGRYDGTVGVLGGSRPSGPCSAGFRPRALDRADHFHRRGADPLGIGCLGSRLLTGALDAEASRRCATPPAAVRRRRARSRGFAGPAGAVRLPPGAYAAFVELHIEQGPELERGAYRSAW